MSAGMRLWCVCISGMIGVIGAIIAARSSDPVNTMVVLLGLMAIGIAGAIWS